MVRTIFLSLLAGIVAVAGLILAATSQDGAWQTFGILILLLAWGGAVGYHGRRAERVERMRLGLPDSDPASISTHIREWSMLKSLAVSVIFAILGVVGLIIAANADDSVAQFMGLGLLVLSWFFVVGINARRAEAEERARHGAAH
jgi:uncharacterized membrane protein